MVSVVGGGRDSELNVCYVLISENGLSKRQDIELSAMISSPSLCFGQTSSASKQYCTVGWLAPQAVACSKAVQSSSLGLLASPRRCESLGEGLGRPHVCLNDHVLLRRRNASVECRVLKYDCAQSGMAIIGGLCNAVG